MKNDLATILYMRAESFSNKNIYSFIDSKGTIQNLNYEELLLSSEKFARALSSMTRSQEAILLSLEPSLKFIEILFGCILAKRIFIPTYPMRSKHDIARIEALTKKYPVSLIITDRILEQNGWSPLVSPIVSVSDLEHIGFNENKHNSPMIFDSDIIFFQPSSGTTRFPKAVMVTNDALISCLGNMQDALKLSSDDIGCSWLPPYHDMGLIGAILLPLFVNFPVYLMRPSNFIIDPINWLKIISKYKISVTAAPNLAYELCCSRYSCDLGDTIDLSHLRLAINSAEMIKSTTLHRFYNRFKDHGLRWEALSPAYGLAEATLMVSSKPCDEGPRIMTFSRDELRKGRAKKNNLDFPTDKVELVSSGKAINKMDIKIVDRETQTLRKTYEIGEIWVRGNSITTGYFQDEESNNAVYVTPNFDSDSSVYVRTGDSGFLDDEGYVFVTGRIKDAIKTSNGLVFAEEIESLVDELLPVSPIYSSAALLLSDQEKTEIVILKEVPDSQFCKKYADLIQEHLRQYLTIRIDMVVFLPQGAIPRTTSGKIKRHAAIILMKYDLFEYYKIIPMTDKI